MNINQKIPVLTGTAIPLAALKTKNSCGVGEYLDLIPFASFCKKANLGLIQLLPVNDTGTESSPYSALSAFALHPLYVSVESLPEYSGNSEVKKAVKSIHEKYDNEVRFNYRKIREEKMSVLRQLFQSVSKNFIADISKPKSAVSKWVKENPWVIEYAVFMELKRQFNEASWKTWPKEFRKITKEKILERWQDEKLLENHLFFAWVQMRASEQFKEAADYIAEKGIILKGDIPIMMNEDSADAWAHPEFFDDKMRAGSPPDGFNPLGQNWGFPIYRWDNLEKDGYSWWKNRLVCASKYYKAYRIDHVLGFFRIWATSDRETTATMGMTLPSSFITLAELEKAGFDKNRIRWLSQPHVPTRAIEDVNNNDYLGTHGILNKIMDRIGQEELWLFKPEIKGDKDIWENPEIPEPVKAKLAEFWRNRTLVPSGSGKFVPLWTYKETTAWQSLSEEEKNALEKILAKKSEKQDKLWEAQARKILGELTSATDMIACAEDLGANPECLPQVLSDLSILRLCVVRWCRDWAEEGQPFIAFEDYPKNSVATASVHDSSTLRLWWLEENDSPAFIRDFPPENKDGKILEKVYTPETATYLLKRMATAASCFCIHPIQDFLSLSTLYYNDNPKLEVVNVPGSVNEFNWTYRLPVNVENLSADKDLILSIKSVVNLHK